MRPRLQIQPPSRLEFDNRNVPRDDQVLRTVHRRALEPECQRRSPRPFSPGRPEQLTVLTVPDLDSRPGLRNAPCTMRGGPVCHAPPPGAQACKVPLVAPFARPARTRRKDMDLDRPE